MSRLLVPFIFFVKNDSYCKTRSERSATMCRSIHKPNPTTTPPDRACPSRKKKKTQPNHKKNTAQHSTAKQTSKKHQSPETKRRPTRLHKNLPSGRKYNLRLESDANKKWVLYSGPPEWHVLLTLLFHHRKQNPTKNCNYNSYVYPKNGGKVSLGLRPRSQHILRRN